MVVSGIGAKMLTKMGWSQGTGLGKKRDGLIAPISVKKRPENLGVGAERRPFQNAWWEKMMEDAYGTSTTDDPAALFEACEGRRCRPHGSAKLARLEAHEKSTKDGQEEVELDEEPKVLKMKKMKKRGVSDGEKSGRIGKKRRKSKKTTAS